MSRLYEGVKRLGQAFEEHDLLTYASAISFQVFSAIVPFLMFAIALMGFLDLGGIWTDHLARDLKPQVSAAAFTVIDDAVRKALGSKQGFWITAGFMLALWQISGAVRAIMGALNTLYRTKTRRSWTWRMLVSFALSLGVAACFLLALVVVVAGPLVFDEVGAAAGVGLFVLRYAVAAGLFLVAVALLVHYAPEQHQPLSAVGFGSVLVIGAWILMSGGFGFYLTEVASYGSVFGSLATVVVLIGYIYASALVFLGGIQIDALVREDARAAKQGAYAAGGAPA